MNWKILIALLLLLPVYWEEILPDSAVGFAQHMTEMGEHCFDHCPYPISPIDRPKASTLFSVLDDELPPHEQLIALLPLDHAAHDRPPPLFYSTGHSFRGPPTLIPV